MMDDDPLWIDVSALMQRHHDQLTDWIDEQPGETKQFDGNIRRLWSIRSSNFDVARQQVHQSAPDEDEEVAGQACGKGAA